MKKSLRSQQKRRKSQAQNSLSKSSDWTPLVIIKLPVILATANETTGRHWSVLHKLRKQYEWELVAIGARAERYLAAPWEVRRVRIVSFRPALIRDTDNLDFSVKKLLDAMVNIGLLFDDSKKYLYLDRVEQERDPDNPRTEITIYKEGK